MYEQAIEISHSHPRSPTSSGPASPRYTRRHRTRSRTSRGPPRSSPATSCCAGRICFALSTRTALCRRSIEESSAPHRLSTVLLRLGPQSGPGSASAPHPRSGCARDQPSGRDSSRDSEGPEQSALDRTPCPETTSTQVQTVLDREKGTLDEGAALRLLANVRNKGKYLHKGVIFCNPIDHEFLHKINKFLINQQNIRPIFAQF